QGHFSFRCKFLHGCCKRQTRAEMRQTGALVIPDRIDKADTDIDIAQPDIGLGQHQGILLIGTCDILLIRSDSSSGVRPYSGLTVTSVYQAMRSAEKLRQIGIGRTEIVRQPRVTTMEL